jgi:hypothetical protein
VWTGFTWVMKFTNGGFHRRLEFVAFPFLCLLNVYYFVKKDFVLWNYVIMNTPKSEVKIKLSLCFFLTEHHIIKANWRWRYSSTHSLTSSLDGGEWSYSHPGRFTPRERSPNTQLYRRLGGPQSRSGRGGVEKIHTAIINNAVPVVTKASPQAASS